MLGFRTRVLVHLTTYSSATTKLRTINLCIVSSLTIERSIEPRGSGDDRSKVGGKFPETLQRVT